MLETICCEDASVRQAKQFTCNVICQCFLTQSLSFAGNVLFITTAHVKKHKQKKAGNKFEDMRSICLVFSLLCLDIKPNLLFPFLTYDKFIFSVGFCSIFHALFENV